MRKSDVFLDFQLWRHGEMGVTAKDYCLRFKFDNSWHELQVNVFNFPAKNILKYLKK